MISVTHPFRTGELLTLLSLRHTCQNLLFGADAIICSYNKQQLSRIRDIREISCHKVQNVHNMGLVMRHFEKKTESSLTAPVQIAILLPTRRSRLHVP